MRHFGCRILAVWIVIATATSFSHAAVIYYSEWEPDPPYQQQIVRSTEDGSIREVLVQQDERIDAIALDTQRGRMYWIGPDGIRRSGMDGSGVALIVSTPEDWGKDIEVDASGGRIYWRGSSGIYRAGLDGSGVELIVELESPSGGIGLHVPSGKVFWAENHFEDTDRIRRANLDGTVEETILESEQWYSVRILEIDPDDPGARVYWDQQAPVPDSGMAAADLDGSNHELLDFVSAGSANQIAVSGNRLYWSEALYDEPGCFKGFVYRGFSDGTQEQTLFETHCIGGGLAVDPASDAVPASSTWSLAVLVAILVTISSLAIVRRRTGN